MKLPKVGNTLFLKDLAESNTLDELFEMNYFDLSLPFSLDSVEKKEPSYEEKSNGYSPKFIRGSGSEREGKCDICEKWFKLKTSSYWYHMNYKHGVNSKGIKCPEPIFKDKNKPVEGYCKMCNQWIYLGNSKKKSNFPWLRHWQKHHKY